MIEAIRSGSVDSLMIGPRGEERVYTLASADRPYRLIIEAMSEGAATISPRGVILNANPRLGSMVGKPAAELIGEAVLQLVPKEQRTKFARLIDIGVDKRAHGEVELSRADGTTIPVLVAMSAFELEDTRLRCLVMTDLTEQRQAEAEIRRLNADLEARVARRTADLAQANENLEAFTYSVAHDLRSPLRAMSGFSEALLEEYADRLDEGGREYATRIESASQHMAQLIDDLLHLSSVSRAEIHLEPVDLSREVASVAQELQNREPDRQVNLVIEDGVWVTADRLLIHTVVENLIGNAWKFTSHRTKANIEFGTVPATNAPICCYVRDDGAGFDPAYMNKLFQPFQRLHSTTDFPGTGIGLASVRRIIERHGGRAWAEGAVDHGATFYFTLGAKEPK